MSLTRPSRLDNSFVFHSVFRDQLPAKLQLFSQLAREKGKNIPSLMSDYRVAHRIPPERQRGGKRQEGGFSRKKSKDKPSLYIFLYRWFSIKTDKDNPKK